MGSSKSCGNGGSEKGRTFKVRFPEDDPEATRPPYARTEHRRAFSIIAASHNKTGTKQRAVIIPYIWTREQKQIIESLSSTEDLIERRGDESALLELVDDMQMLSHEYSEARREK